MSWCALPPLTDLQLVHVPASLKPQALTDLQLVHIPASLCRRKLRLALDLVERAIQRLSPFLQRLLEQATAVDEEAVKGKDAHLYRVVFTRGVIDDSPIRTQGEYNKYNMKQGYSERPEINASPGP